MKQYHTLVADTLANATYKPNRTAVDTLSTFSQQYTVDLQDGFPLLTTKDLSGGRWNSLTHELVWYLSGDAHISELSEETAIWDAWADENDMLETAYGRFWRRYPLPEHTIEGEAWADDAHRWVNDDEKTFDQVQYVIDQLQENPSTRRLVINAWHPANAAVSTLPPCHFTYVLNVQGGTLNCHLTQRSGDIALGVPFNIASYALLTKLFAQQTGFEVGEFSHSIVDAHIYCGSEDRGAWYADNLTELQERLPPLAGDVPTHEHGDEYREVRDWIQAEAPPESDDDAGKDHVPNLLTQLTRESRDRPTLNIASQATVDTLSVDDIELCGYDPHPAISFAVAT